MTDNKPMLRLLRRELPTYRSERFGSSLRLVCPIPSTCGLTMTEEDVLWALTA